MPASSLTELYAIERHVAAAAETIIGGALTIPAYANRAPDLKARPRVECLVSEVARASDQMVIDAGNTPRYCHYSGQLRVRLVTLRSETDAAAHGAFVAQIRATIDPALQTFDAPTLPYYDMLSMEETGTAADTDDAEDTDITEVTIAFELGIPPGEFPVAV